MWQEYSKDYDSKGCTIKINRNYNLDHKQLVKTPQEMWIDELISYLRTKTTNLKLHCTLIYKKPKGFHWFSLFSHCQSMTTESSYMHIRIRYLLPSERIFQRDQTEGQRNLAEKSARKKRLRNMIVKNQIARFIFKNAELYSKNNQCKEKERCSMEMKHVLMSYEYVETKLK